MVFKHLHEIKSKRVTKVNKNNTFSDTYYGLWSFVEAAQEPLIKRRIFFCVANNDADEAWFGLAIGADTPEKQRS